LHYNLLLFDITKLQKFKLKHEIFNYIYGAWKIQIKILPNGF
jgi:hypothetical protein